MTKKEVVQILAILKAAYPNSYNNLTKEEASGTVAVWGMQFADVPADIVLMALHKLIASSKFPPSISEVKNKIGSLRWEAYEVISSPNRAHIPEETLKQYQRVYDATYNYGKTGFVEPTLQDMIGGDSRLMLN